jgi:ribose transport system substrate-binding protein
MVAVGAALALAACSSSGTGGVSSGSSVGSSHSASSAAGPVSVNVGNGTPIKLRGGPLKVGLLLQGSTNEWNQVLASAATEEAKKFGYQVSFVSANFDLNTQLNQLQSAAADHEYDAVVLEPISAVSECTAETKTLPAANVLAITTGEPCNTSLQGAGNELWVPGTLTTVAGDTTISYARAFFKLAAKLNPGPQQVVVATGPQLDPLVIAENQVAKEMAASNPQFHIESFVYGDWTTPTALQKTESYIQGHPATTLILSAYSPDITRGVIAALTALGKLGKIKIADEGGTTYSVQQIKAGNLQFTLPYFPQNYGTYAIDAIHAAQMGQSVPRFISVIPAQFGGVNSPTVITKNNLASYTPRY